MYRGIYLILIFVFFNTTFGQTGYSVSGTVYNETNDTPIEGAKISIEGDGLETMTNMDGSFLLRTDLIGEFILRIAYQDYESKRIPVVLDGKELDLGKIILKRDISFEQQDNLITLTDAELLDDESTSNTLGLLQATRDVFLSRAAFDFGQAFFRVRGYDAQEGEVLLNGVTMNKIFDGRPQWNNWGGLNDITRNQEYTNGLDASDYTFGGILGNTNIDLRPSKLRPGTRISSSASNRTYSGRFMATYNSGVKENGLAYVLSGSRRWANEGFLDGTLYDAYSLSGQLEYKVNEHHSFLLSGIVTTNRRGRSSALTEEVFRLAGKRYNPYWGLQEGRIRNSRERYISEPMFILNYFYNAEKLNLSFGTVYQQGSHKRSRLGYYNAPNPDPTYYRYLPSFYVNSPIGANFISAEMARNSFLQNPQWNWQNVYNANANSSLGGRAAYLLYSDVAADTQFTANLNGNIQWSPNIKLDFGVMNRYLRSENFAEVDDLLGAEFHADIDPFSDTRNDLGSDFERRDGDIFGYHFDFKASEFRAYSQLSIDLNKWKLFMAGQFNQSTYQRIGEFQNERFPNNSFGPSRNIAFSNFRFKGGLTRAITGRHWVSMQGAFIKRAPLLQNVFVNPRESNAIVPNLQTETISTLDVNYFLRLPRLTGRITGYYTRFQNLTDVNFFFVDSGVGSDFVQEVLTDLDKLHLGTELGLEYQVSPTVKVSLVSSIGKFIYASDPSVTINFDTASAEEDLINIQGFQDLGPAKIKGYKLGQGPQQAFAFGIEYRDPKYWWVGATANYLANNYANISTITRTDSFVLDPETGQRFPDATAENVNALLEQKPLDKFYLLNLVGGKSWLKNGKYLGIFASVNNVFDATFRTGGYEQSRNGNFGQLRQDNLSGNPSFAPKYWYGYGRTYFLNIALSF
ncbi:carboxypeptidase-like regulatory domain-containing protein [Maribacter sp. 4G9]|uniref:carboxypeptidase-like regulatory domain-containing protein n=1 Tax=Maribacter sp. 4G9 TaxID=1889777 RepID=UPI000C153985|nr:carboxypeptidase-like regulatory domain-containing protein [Maribacter sp. 4G9]PIB38387.1 TonB-dependent receptor [Maribacter sp. 4G9]